MKKCMHEYCSGSWQFLTLPLCLKSSQQQISLWFQEYIQCMCLGGRQYVWTESLSLHTKKQSKEDNVVKEGETDSSEMERVSQGKNEFGEVLRLNNGV